VKKQFTPEQLQKFAQKLQEKMGGTGPGKGFVIMVWDGTKLNHVTTSRKEMAAMIATQLSDWANEHIDSEERQVALARQAQQAPVAMPPPVTNH
jgi:hypothetical protein